VIADSPILSPVNVLLTPQLPVSRSVTQSSPGDKAAAAPQITRAASEFSSQTPLTSDSHGRSRLATAPSITPKEDMPLISLYTSDSEPEPPVIGPKLPVRNQVWDGPDATIEDEDDDDDNLYNYPRQDLYRPQLSNNLSTAPLATASSITHKEDLQLISPHATDNELEPPMLYPKLRDQVRDGADAATVEDSDDEEVYNYPRQELHRPQLTGGQEHDETYDTPSRLRQHTAVSSNDTHDLPPKLYRYKARYLNIDDDVYDLPKKLCTNITSDCVASADDGVVSHHSYINVDSSLSVDVTRPEVSNMEHADRILADSNGSEIYDVVVSSRTRSFKSANSWYVFNSSLQSLSEISLEIV